MKKLMKTFRIRRGIFIFFKKPSLFLDYVDDLSSFFLLRDKRKKMEKTVKTSE